MRQTSPLLTLAFDLRNAQTRSMPPDDKKLQMRRVLLYRLGSLGDMLVALPVIHLVARAYPKAERRLLTSFPPNAKAPAASSILESTGLVHGYFRYSYATRNMREILMLWWQLVRWRPQVLIYMSGSGSIEAVRRNHLFFRICGIRKFIGIPATPDMQYCLSIAQESGSTVQGNGLLFEHEASRLARNLREVGDAALDAPESWDLRLTGKEHLHAASHLAPLQSMRFVALGLGTKNESNHWGLENWSALLLRLARAQFPFALVILGAPVEKEESEALAHLWRRHAATPVLNLCGELTPRESAAVLGRGALYIGHDSGPIHLAAAVQTPCVGIYGARNPAGIWFPYGKQHQVLYHHVSCEGCRLHVCTVERKRCILSITVDEVLNAIERALSKPLSSRPIPGNGRYSGTGGRP